MWKLLFKLMLAGHCCFQIIRSTPADPELLEASYTFQEYRQNCLKKFGEAKFEALQFFRENDVLADIAVQNLNEMMRFVLDTLDVPRLAGVFFESKEWERTIAAIKNEKSKSEEEDEAIMPSVFNQYVDRAVDKVKLIMENFQDLASLRNIPPSQVKAINEAFQGCWKRSVEESERNLQRMRKGCSDVYEDGTEEEKATMDAILKEIQGDIYQNNLRIVETQRFKAFKNYFADQEEGKHPVDYQKKADKVFSELLYHYDK